jgi:HSP20 family protein
MSSAKQDKVAKVEKVEKSGAPQTLATYVPDVDILEDSERIRLVADIPGASQADVEVTVENNVLTINAAAAVTGPEGCALAGQEYGVGNYHRDFALSDAVSVDGITAKVKHGVLEVVIPKREEVKTRKIKIE